MSGDIRARLRELIAGDNIEEALDALRSWFENANADAANEVSVHQGRLAGARRRYRSGVMGESDYTSVRAKIGVAVLELADEGTSSQTRDLTVAATKRPSRPVDDSSQSVSVAPVVFVSYSHTELTVALRVKQMLTKHGLRVLLDADDLRPGEDIEGFVRRCVAAADVVVAVVSSASLASSWVIFEVATALSTERSAQSSKFVACAVDREYCRAGFRLELTRAIDERVANLNTLIGQHLERHLDLAEVSTERDRLVRMRGELGRVIARLQSALTLEIGTDVELVSSMERLASHARAVSAS